MRRPLVLPGSGPHQRPAALRRRGRWQAVGCELPKGHPGPHLHFADLERCGAGEEDPAALAS